MEAYAFFFDSDGNLWSEWVGSGITPADLPLCYFWTA